MNDVASASHERLEEPEVEEGLQAELHPPAHAEEEVTEAGGQTVADGEDEGVATLRPLPDAVEAVAS